MGKRSMIGKRFDRRSFLAGAGATLFSCTASAGLPIKAQERIDNSDQLFVSAYMDPSRNFGLAVLNEAGKIIYRQSLPARGHGIAAQKGLSKAIIFARRPGNFALAFDPTQRLEPILFHTDIDRHFYGHGVFSPDGRLLYATENDFDGVRGVIGVYDVTNRFTRIGEFSSGGLGPHDMVLVNGGRVLCVANGGIETHPKFGRQKLNLDHMQSNIAFIDRRNGQLIEAHLVAKNWSKLSLRHMAVDGRDRLWLGGQYQGVPKDEPQDQPPLIGSVALGQPLELLDLPISFGGSLRNYIGSVAASDDGAQIAFSMPKDNHIVILDTITQKPVHAQYQKNACGLSARGGSFLSSSENGDFSGQTHDLFWDNHIGKIDRRV